MRERDIFIEALQQNDPISRAALLDDACQGDATLHRQVQLLLAEHERQESFILDTPPAVLDATLDHARLSERPGTVIGPYKLLQQIGEGGMGVVFMAEQTEPLQRTVALKIIKPGMDTRQVIARFEAERQALAMMDHPNIAKVLDAGTTDSGRPYFVMELVKGVPITQYCDEKHLPLRARLELLVPVCQAVQHAHQKGLIHRDIKPSNVLVAEYDDQAVPKVIDFGVAKATAQKLTDRTMFTEFGQVVGTVEYMSPEQAKFNQLDIDTRSDIYSLGVLLYELLTGSTPFGRKRLQEAAFDEMLRIIREEEPPKPSTRLSTADGLPSIAINRGSEPLKLNRLVRGELDWMVMKALEKDRNRRYETANSFAADIQRYLDDEAVEACPPSSSYRLRKLARRHKTALWTAGLVAIAMCVGTVVSTWQAVRATHAEALAQTRLESEQEARQRATAEAAKATTISTLLQQMLGSANPDAAKGRDYTMRQMLDDFSAGLKDKLHDQPEVEANIYKTIGNAYRGLGSSDKAEMYLKSALELRVKLFGPEHADVAESLVDYSWRLYERGDYVGAEERAREALAIHRKLDLQNEEMVGTLGALQCYLIWQAKYEEAEQIANEALEIARRHPEQNLDVASVLHHLALAATWQGDLIKAEQFARRAVELHRKRNGEGPATRHGLIFLANSLLCQQKFDEAEACYREALAIHLKHFDESQPPVVEWLGLAETLGAKGDQAGLDALRATIDLTSTNTENGNDWNYRGSLFAELGDWEQAETALVKGAEQEANPECQSHCRFYLALIRLARNDLPGYREACTALVKHAEQSSEPEAAAWACVLAPDSFNKPHQVVLLAQRAYESNPKVPKYRALLGEALYRAGRFDEARKRFADALEATPIGTSNLYAVTCSRLFLAMTHQRLGQPVEARKWLNEAVQAIDKPATVGERRLMETWHKKLALQILRKEADAVLADGKENRNPTTVAAPL